MLVCLVHANTGSAGGSYIYKQLLWPSKELWAGELLLCI